MVFEGLMTTLPFEPVTLLATMVPLAAFTVYFGLMTLPV